MSQYTILMTSEDGGSKMTAVTADDLDDLREQADEQTRDWIRDGEWGSNGASVLGGWEALDDDGETLIDDDGNEVMGCVTVEIEPDHSHLIHKACGGRHDARNDRCCGTDPDDHDWTSEGEGGCSENPGVWSTGGTSGPGGEGRVSVEDRDDLLAALRNLADAAEAFAADQSRATHPRCGLVQPVTVAECKRLRIALLVARAVLGRIGEAAAAAIAKAESQP